MVLFIVTVAFDKVGNKKSKNQTKAVKNKETKQ
jgi:hypothetical protein